MLILQPASRAFGNDVNRTITHFGLSRALAQRLLAPLLELLGLLVLLLCDRSALDKPDSKALEESVLVVWEMLGKDEHDEFFCRINEA